MASAANWDIPLLQMSKAARLDLVRGLSSDQARWLVDYYYAVQDHRIRAAGQVRAIQQGADQGTFEIGEYLAGASKRLEAVIEQQLDAWTTERRPGRWMKSVHGIGPVLAAGVLAHVDITKAPTVGHIWSFAGLNPEARWEKGQKRPWNARLKVHCWKIGDSFVKHSAHENCVYGHAYRHRKAYEVERNEAGLLADAAAKSLRERNIQDPKLKKTLESGKLPDGQIDMRAKRWAVKLYLSHCHHVMHEDHYGTPPPKPYVLSHLGHVDFVAPRGWPCD